jgi:type I restriction enzyme, R subunit
LTLDLVAFSSVSRVTPRGEVTSMTSRVTLAPDEKVNELFEGELTDQDQLVYVDNVIKTKMLESKTLIEQAASNTKEQFAASPDIDSELLGAIMAALDAHNTMSTQALDSEQVRAGLKDILLNYAGLWEAPRAKSAFAREKATD